MTGDEVLEFLGRERTVVCATFGHDGWPHLMPLWYLVADGEVWAWTYAKSQKVRNLERDDRATLMIEAGEEYQELRGVMIETTATIHHDVDLVTDFGIRLFQRYSDGAGGDGSQFADAVRAQAAKRVVLQFAPRRTASWDHRKLAAGVY